MPERVKKEDLKPFFGDYFINEALKKGWKPGQEIRFEFSDTVCCECGKVWAIPIADDFSWEGEDTPRCDCLERFNKSISLFK